MQTKQVLRISVLWFGVKSPFVSKSIPVSSSVTVAISMAMAVVMARIVVRRITVVAIVAAVMGVVVMLVVMCEVDLNLFLFVCGLWHLDDIDSWDFDDLGHFFLNYALIG